MGREQNFNKAKIRREKVGYTNFKLFCLKKRILDETK